MSNLQYRVSQAIANSIDWVNLHQRYSAIYHAYCFPKRDKPGSVNLLTRETARRLLDEAGYLVTGNVHRI
jgi:hypothetical protein